MKTLTLSLLAAAAVGTVACAMIGGAGAMPFSNNATLQSDSLVQDVRVVCNRNGNCWNTGGRSYRTVRRGYAPGYYDRRGYYGEQRGYGYYGGPRVGVGVGPFGFGLY